MKYTVCSAYLPVSVGNTDDLLEAIKMREAYDLEHAEDMGAIWDNDTGLAVDEHYDWYEFTCDIVLASDAGREPMDRDEAELNLREMAKDGVDVPQGLTGAVYAYYWNKAIQHADELLAEQKKLAQECIREDDEAEYQQTIRDAQLEKFQLAIDCAVADRDKEGKRWQAMTEDGLHSELDCHRAYTRYQQAQGFLEGLTNGIFVAGYNILTAVGSTKLTVIKKED